MLFKLEKSYTKFQDRGDYEKPCDRHNFISNGSAITQRHLLDERSRHKKFPSDRHKSDSWNQYTKCVFQEWELEEKKPKLRTKPWGMLTAGQTYRKKTKSDIF